jgi:hypothetical protein
MFKYSPKDGGQLNYFLCINKYLYCVPQLQLRQVERVSTYNQIVGMHMKDDKGVFVFIILVMRLFSQDAVVSFTHFKPSKNFVNY